MTKVAAMQNSSIVKVVDAKMHVGKWMKKAPYPRTRSATTIEEQLQAQELHFQELGENLVKFEQSMAEQLTAVKLMHLTLGNSIETNKLLIAQEKVRLEELEHLISMSGMAQQARQEYKIDQDAANEYEAMNEAAFAAEQDCKRQMEDDSDDTNYNVLPESQTEDDDEGETKAYKMRRDAENEAAFMADIDIKRAKDDDEYSDFDVFNQ